jgi:hypothetical protein
MTPDRPRVHPQQALAVYVETLAVGQRVAVLGDASLGIGVQLAELGASSVYAWDPDTDRALREAEHAPPGVVVRPLSGADLMEQYGAFDLAVVTDLELFDEPETLLADVRRLVGQEGVALVVAPNGEAGRARAFDYYELFDLVAREFEEVTMIAQLPFFGVALAELGEEEDESLSVSVDTQLAEGDRAPEAFIALASQRGVRLDPYAIVELPPSLPTPASTIEEVTRFEKALRDRTSRIAELERELAEREHRIGRLSNELDLATMAVAEHRAAAARLDDAALRAGRAEEAVAALEAELTRVGDAHSSEIARYEDALRERAQSIRLLETELDRRERMVRELVDELEATANLRQPAFSPEGATHTERDALAKENAELRHKLDGLALELARHEGERQARAWTIAELERRLEAAPTPTQPPDTSRGATTESRLAAALDELDVLRRALTQEHEARLRAESREAPAAARAEAQR